MCSLWPCMRLPSATKLRAACGTPLKPGGMTVSLSAAFTSDDDQV